MSAIHERIAAITSRFSGQLGLWAYSPDTQETIDIGGQEIYPSASTIKLPVLYELYRQAIEGRFRLTDPLTLQADDVVPGSGVLQDLTPGLSLAIKDLATLMIVVSDNTATNLLIDLVGCAAVNQSLDDLGITQTRLHNQMFKGTPGGPRNCATPADLGRLMLLIATEQVLTPAACQEMLEILFRQQYTDNITRRIPDFHATPAGSETPYARAASKSGSIDGVRNDVAYMEARGKRYVIGIMSQSCTDLRYHVDNEGSQVLSDVSAAVYDHFVKGE